MRRRRAPLAVHNEGGFTLVELLVSMLAGMIVMIAVLGVLDFSLRQSARATDRVEASQRGRTTMEQIMQLLHSSCVAASVTPVRPGSDSTNVQFLSQMGSAAIVVPDLHKISLTSSTLTDTVYPETSGSAPTWTFSATPTITKTMLTNVGQGAINGVTQPIFQYYKYVNGTLSTTALTTPLSPADAAATAEVAITFAASPTGSTDADRTVNLSDTAVLRYVPASGDIAVVNLPCQ